PEVTLNQRVERGSVVSRLMWEILGAVPVVVAVRLSNRAHYLMTSSAFDRSDCGIVTPIAFAVLRLMKSSNRPRSTGRSLGFSPLRILSTIMGTGPPKIVV